MKFGTLRRIGEATRAELMSVKGITEEIANEIIKAFKGE
jgi:ERCC4-type nuclease